MVGLRSSVFLSAVLLILSSVVFVLPVRASQSATTIAVACSPNSAAFNSWVACKATVAGSAPTGPVTFSDFAQSFPGDTGVFAPASGICTLTRAVSNPNVGFCTVAFQFLASGCLIYCRPSTFQITASYGGDSNNQQISGTLQPDKMLHFHTCWISECLVNNAPYGDFTDYICVIGNLPTEALADCKQADTSYSATGLNLSNEGIEIPGAGMWAALASTIVPGSGCPEITVAVGFATTQDGYAVGTQAGNIDAAALGGACGLSLSLYLAGAAFSAAFGGKPVPDAGTITALMGVVQAANGLTGFAGSQAVANLAVIVAAGCGFVNYYCYGANLTANIIANPLGIQAKNIPFFPVNLAPWGDHNGFQAIGWSMPSCTDATFCTNAQSLCGPNGTQSPCLKPPVEGTAGQYDGLDIHHPDYSQINTNAPIECATGRIRDLSIGYDGDATFNLNDTSILPLVNPGNEGGGSLGPPFGIVVEFPPAQRADTSIVSGGQPLSSTLVKLRVGMVAHVCGRWVTDTRDLWNELHPANSLTILPDFSMSALPSSATILAGESQSYTPTATSSPNSPVPTSPVSMNIISGLPPGASFVPGSATFTGTTATSTLKVLTVPGTFGSFSLMIQGQVVVPCGSMQCLVTSTNVALVHLIILTPQQALQMIGNQINSFESNGILNSGQANSLITKLMMAIENLNVGDRKTACNQLNALVNEVNSYVFENILTQSQANQLVNPPFGIAAIMASIPC